MERKLTSPTVLRDLLARHGIRLRSELGQHFLVDENTLARIVDLVEAQGDETAVEVGAGAGTLTCALAPRVRELVAVEVDRRLIPVLEETTASHSNVRILRGDFRELSLGSFGERILLVGNLPYGITSDVLVKVIREREAVERAVFMVQAEVGAKLVAPPGPEASRLGVHLRGYFDVEVARKVPRTVFFPPPEVDSALIRLRKLTQPRITAPEPAFEQTLALIFSGRRKTLRRALLGQFPAEEVGRILTEVGLDPRVRGEALPLSAMDRLAESLSRGASQGSRDVDPGSRSG
jgi:16S rRNA (adenine1518-N6/adenine1519-N6)-dimethyltransferase